MELKQGEIYMAMSPQAGGQLSPMARLMAEKLPVMVSFGLAKLQIALKDSVTIVESVKGGLIQKHGPKPEGNAPIQIKPGDPNWPTFIDEFNQLLEEVIDVKFEPVELPLVVASTCDQCHHNMDRPLEISGDDVLALIKFITVKPGAGP